MPVDAVIAPAATPDELAEVAALFRAYQASLDVDLAYQDFAEELASLPGKYRPPLGLLLIARNAEGEALGCVGLRAIDRRRCEMKRLYVAPAGRGSGLGRQLVERLIHEARRIGYAEMVLDTLPTMAAAQGLYRSFGFEPVSAYYDTPIEGTAFLGLDLAT